MTNVRAVVGSNLMDDATVEVVDGVVTSVDAGSTGDRHAVDGRRLLLMPGLVDTHSDGLEKEASPRRNVRFPMPYALGSFEARVRSAGITTIAHGVAYQDKPRMGRSVDEAREMFDHIAERRSRPAAVDHRVLYRVEARDGVAVSPLVDDIAAGRTAGSDRPLVSFEDHTPGQGQYRDRAQYARQVDPSTLAEGQTVDEFVDALIEQGEREAHHREANLRLLQPLAREGRITLLAHDPENAEDIERRRESGASVAEFPVSTEAAAAAREYDMPVVMGAPNALRGGSHNGNASARELVAEGLCDVIASDYMPSAMLASVFAMAADGVADLPELVGLVTSGPASMLGLPDRGVLSEGARADMILVDDTHAWPQVAHSWRSGETWTPTPMFEDSATAVGS